MYLNRVHHSFTEWNGRFITVPFKSLKLTYFILILLSENQLFIIVVFFVKETCRYLQQRKSEVKVSVKTYQFLGKKNDDIFPGC